MVDLIERDALLKDMKSDCPDSDVCIAETSCIECIIGRQTAVNRWIPCSERLPEKTGYYLVCDSTAEFDNIRGRQDVSKFVIGRHGGHWYGAIRREYITHWMPLPEPPEKE